MEIYISYISILTLFLSFFRYLQFSKMNEFSCEIFIQYFSFILVRFVFLIVNC